MDRYSAEKLIRQYFQNWLEQDLDLFCTLSPEAVVIECYGPMYCGHEEARAWFIHWHNRPEKGKVTRWDIFNILYDEAASRADVDWSFEYIYDGESGSFLGTSLIDFNDTHITRIQEYKMEQVHYRPYARSARSERFSEPPSVAPTHERRASPRRSWHLPAIHQ